MEVMAWSMIMTGGALFGMLVIWLLRGDPHGSLHPNRLRTTAAASADPHPEDI